MCVCVPVCLSVSLSLSLSLSRPLSRPLDLSLDLSLCVFVKVTPSTKGYKEYHARAQTLPLWSIEQATWLDLDDPNWRVFYLSVLLTSGRETWT